MKGIVFVAFNRMVEEKYGLRVWQNILEMCEPVSKGVYIASDDYSEKELISMNRYLSRLMNKKENDLYFEFGKYLFQYFARRYPHFFEGRNLKSAISIIDQIINKDLKKMYPDLEAPKFNYEELAENRTRLIFESHYNLSDITLGIIEAMAIHYNEKYFVEVNTHKKHLMYLNVFELSFLSSIHLRDLDEVA